MQFTRPSETIMVYRGDVISVSTVRIPLEMPAGIVGGFAFELRHRGRKLQSLESPRAAEPWDAIDVDTCDMVKVVFEPGAI